MPKKKFFFILFINFEIMPKSMKIKLICCIQKEKKAQKIKLKLKAAN